VMQGPVFKSSNVSLAQGHTIYIDHAGANHDNGGN
jgi:hypothetical protein